MNRGPEERAYLTEQLIAYIGNKRRLLGFLEDVFSELEREHPIQSFADPFAGSGAVSRLARYRGYRLTSGDWEEYSRLLVSSAVCCDREEAQLILSDFGGLEIYRHLQKVGEGGEPSRPFISRYYAPRETEHADYRRERLFYTRENACFIDRVRGRIEELIPGDPEDRRLRLAKDLMIAPLLYGAATRVNTSGVFKAFHKGFGGHGGDALKRIVSPILLEEPPLITGASNCRVYRCPAAQLLQKGSFDLCYLDPPYNQHQYGSNYHLLNTIAKWDFPPLSNQLDDEGCLVSRAGIRGDWRETRSAFCSRRSVRDAFVDLLERFDGRFLALSYSSDGLLPLEELYELLEAYGQLRIFSSDYTVYRGGRQSPKRKQSNLELLFLLDRTGTGRTSAGVGRRELSRLLEIRHLTRLFQESYHPERLQERISLYGDYVQVLGERIPCDRAYRFSSVPKHLIEKCSGEQRRGLIEDLEYARCRDRCEEAQVLRALMEQQGKRGDLRRLVSAMRKLAHRKYREEWERELAECRQLAQRCGTAFPSLSRELDRLEELAKKRFEG